MISVQHLIRNKDYYKKIKINWVFSITARSLELSHTNRTRNYYATVYLEEIVDFIKDPYIPVDNTITLFIILKLHYDYQIVQLQVRKLYTITSMKMEKQGVSKHLNVPANRLRLINVDMVNDNKTSVKKDFI